jgi:hypothetical protein
LHLDLAICVVPAQTPLSALMSASSGPVQLSLPASADAISVPVSLNGIVQVSNTGLYNVGLCYLPGAQSIGTTDRAVINTLVFNPV